MWKLAFAGVGARGCESYVRAFEIAVVINMWVRMTGVSCSFTYLAAIAKALERRNVIEVEAS